MGWVSITYGFIHFRAFSSDIMVALIVFPTWELRGILMRSVPFTREHQCVDGCCISVKNQVNRSNYIGHSQSQLFRQQSKLNYKTGGPRTVSTP